MISSTSNKIIGEKRTLLFLLHEVDFAAQIMRPSFWKASIRTDINSVNFLYGKIRLIRANLAPLDRLIKSSFVHISPVPFSKKEIPIILEALEGLHKATGFTLVEFI